MPIYNPYSIQSISNELFITADNGIYKTDKSLNIVNSYIRTNAGYRGIYHNSTSDILYVASYSSSSLDLFNRNLIILSSISLTGNPWTFTEKNGKLYVGFTDRSISVLENNLVVKNITILCSGGWISSIVIDSNDLMGVLCTSNSMLYLYTTNGSYTGKNMITPSLPRCMSYDLNGYFIIAGRYQINLYY